MSNPGGIDFNISPHYDDYDEDDKFVRILYRPGRAVQARELTQAQTILQKQIERLGDVFFKEGSIVDGCEQGLDLNLSYVKLEPTYNSNTVNVASFLDKEIIGANSGVKAKVGITTDVEGDDPKTLYVNYISSGTGVLSVNAIPTGVSSLVVGNSIGTANGSAIIRYWDANLSKIYVTDPQGTYNLSSTTPEVVTTLDNNNALVYLLVTGATDARTVKEFANSEVLFTAENLEVNKAYANTLAEYATTHVANGKEYTRASKATVGDGVIYTADHFIKHSNQTIILDKYTNEPSYKVGVVTTKEVVDYIEDNSLVDNAQGTPNYQAPGADRFKIDTVLTKVPLDQETSETEFISLMEIEEGVIVKKKTFELEGKIEEVISKRTYEESGDYTLTNPKITIREHLIQGDNGGRYSTADGGNTNLLLLEIDPFIAYVKGFRNEFISKQAIEIQKGLDVQYVEQNKTQINYGNYIQVSDMLGAWDLMEATKIELHNVAYKALSNRGFSSTTVAANNMIGEARVRSIDYVSGVPGTPSAVYNLFLFDVVMKPGKSFSDVRSLYSTGKFGDVVLNELGNAVLRESSFNNAIFQLPYDAIRSIRDINNDVESGFTFKKQFNIDFSTTGSASVTTGDNYETFVGTGLLSDTQKNESYLLVPSSNVFCANIAGFATVSSGSNAVTGVSGTQFTTLFKVGDYVRIRGETHRIRTINSDTSLVLANNHTTGATSNGIGLVFPAEVPIRLTSRGSKVSVSADRAITVTIPGSTSLTIELREDVPTFSAKFIATLNRSSAREMKKTLYPNQQVFIQANTHPSGLSGPYSLGKADVYKVRGIYQSSAFNLDPTSANTDVTGLYIFDSGQRDNTYEHSTIRPKQGVIPTGKLLVVYDYFSHDTSQGLSYMSVDSYPIDDVNETNNTINTSDIPSYVSVSSGITYNLRNCLDFRLRKRDDTANTTNPFDSGLYQIPVGGLHIPSPFSDFDSSLSLYKGRAARLFLNEKGEFGILNGSPGYPSPQIPSSVPGTLDLAVISIPAYPSQPKSVVIEPQKNRRYTMRDIGKIEERVNRLEYYTSLNLLEKQATEISIVDENGIDRFKNGILVDPYTGYNVADVGSPDIMTAISRKEKFAAAQIDLHQIGLQQGEAITSSSGVVRTAGNKVLLSYSQRLFSSNPYASNWLNLTQSLAYDWTGVMTLYPTTDNWMDTINYPDKNLVVDLQGNSDNWRKLPEAWETEYDAWETRWIGTPIVQEATKIKTDVDRVFNVASSKEYESISSNVKLGPTELQSQTRIVDISVNHYMRSRDYIFNVSGLKPYSRLYAFVDGVNVTAHCKSVRIQTGHTVNSMFNLIDVNGFLTVSNTVYVSANTSGELFASANGEITGVFRLPEQTFFVGQREFKLSDDLQNGQKPTTSAKALILSQGVSLINSSTQINTRPPNVNFTSEVEKTSLAKQLGVTGSAIRNPLSQSFFVNDVNYPYGVFVSRIAVYFRSKSSNPATKVYMQIREMENGLPTRKAIGDSTAFVTSAQITTSTNGTAATTFTFDTPVFLLPGVEYCFSLIPEGNKDDFQVWIAGLGRIDLASPFNRSRITKQPAAGTLFTSSNNYNWSVRKKQDLKYDIYIAQFNVNTTGTLFLTNKSANTKINYTHVIPNIAEIKPDKTQVTLELQTSDSSLSLGSYFSIDNLELVSLTSQKMIANTSQETSAGIKSLRYRVQMKTDNRFISPVIDLERVQTIIYDNKINSLTSNTLTGLVSYSAGSNTVNGYGTFFTNDIKTGEYVKFGNEYRQVVSISSNTSLNVATTFLTTSSNVAILGMLEENPTGPYASKSRYISRRVELADGFEANDLNVYLDVNRPVGTDIKVYYKVLSESDSDSFDSKFYQEMTLDGAVVFNNDQNTYSSEKYVVPYDIKSGGSNLLTGTVTISNSSTGVTGDSTRFIEQLKIGDTVRVDADTRVVTSIANNTFLTVDSNFTTSASEKQMYKMLYNSVVYTTPDNRTYSGYKYFAIKIVFLSNNSAITPRVKKLKAVALT